MAHKPQEGRNWRMPSSANGLSFLNLLFTQALYFSVFISSLLSRSWLFNFILSLTFFYSSQELFFLEFAIQTHFYLLIYFFFPRKISPELISANPPLLSEEDWPWANINAHLPPLFICGTPTTAWLLPSGAVSAPRIRTPDSNGQTLGRQEAEHVNLTAAPWASPQRKKIKTGIWLLICYTEH